MQRLTIATNNDHKLQEIKAVIGGYFEILTLRDIGCTQELAEDQDTIEGNSLQKAAYVFNNYHVACFADDSGLEVDALGGAPGVHSAMYAGPQRKAADNMALLLSNLRDKTDRRARFKTVITLCTTQGTRQFEGVVAGSILKQPRGTGGFGYDPIFLPDGFDRTLAEMSMEEKNKISHRARALQKLMDFLKSERIS